MPPVLLEEGLLCNFFSSLCCFFFFDGLSSSFLFCTLRIILCLFKSWSITFSKAAELCLAAPLVEVWCKILLLTVAFQFKLIHLSMFINVFNLEINKGGLFGIQIKRNRVVQSISKINISWHTSHQIKFWTAQLIVEATI